MPKELFDHPYGGTTPFRGYDVTLDGKFFMRETAGHRTMRVTELHVVQNWAQNRLVPIK